MTTEDNSIINAKLLQEYNLQYLKENNDLITSVKKETAKQLNLYGVSHRREQLAKYTRWQGGYYEKESDMYADIDKFLNG